ncbi:uncharacterized protein LOC141778596 [Sebastes fasciatus]|uniref:uncharacterized protein LOC141778596 n=1 Tax=Sebastes fasciatus TaxID=394691 RepID=UPI003D9F98F7
MDMELYVNSPVDEGRNSLEKRENCHPGGSKIYRLVGVSFGLLCILQAALNVSFRLRAVGCSNNVTIGNSTMMSAGDMGVLILERDQLVRERDQLVRERDQLVQERDQLVQEKPQLAKEKKKLQASNSRLIEDKKTLNKTVIEQQNQIKELEMQQNASRCPQRWWTFMSTCYQLSSMQNIWENAKQDCASKGSHLVILNDKLEERIVLSLGGTVRMWMGLHGVRERSTYSLKWTLVDGSTLFYTNWNRWYSDIEEYSGCAYVKQNVRDSSSSETWFVGTCQEQHYWMCEKELHTRSIRPK